MTCTQSTPKQGSARGWLPCGAAVLGAAWLLLPVSDGSFDRYHLPKELWLELLALLLASHTLLRRSRPAWDTVAKLTLALGVVVLVTTALATSPGLAARAASLELSALVLFSAVRALDERGRQRARWCVVLAAAGVAALACLEIFGVVTQLSRTGRAPGASLGQRNMVAHLLALAAPCAFALLDRRQPRQLRWLGMASSLLFAFTVVHTRSRAGWLALAAALLLFELGSWPAAAARGLPSLLCALGVVLALTIPTRLVWSSASPYRDSLVHLLDTEQGSGRGRLAQYRSSLGMVSEHPIAGVGPGNWLVHYPRVSPAGDPAFRAHTWLNTGRLINSDPLALLVEQGPLALALAVLLVITLARGALARPERPIVLGALAAGSVAGSLDAVLQLPTALCCAALVLGSCAPASDTLAAPGSRAWRALALMVLPVLAAASLLSGARLLALWERTRPGGGFEAAERALRWNPADLSARFALAEAYLLAHDCDRARPHVAALRALLPYHQAPREMEEACAPRQ